MKNKEQQNLSGMVIIKFLHLRKDVEKLLVAVDLLFPSSPSLPLSAIRFQFPVTLHDTDRAHCPITRASCVYLSHLVPVDLSVCAETPCFFNGFWLVFLEWGIYQLRELL